MVDWMARIPGAFDGLSLLRRENEHILRILRRFLLFLRTLRALLKGRTCSCCRRAGRCKHCVRLGDERPGDSLYSALTGSRRALAVAQGVMQEEVTGGIKKKGCRWHQLFYCLYS